MMRSEPFQLTEPDIRRAGLDESDIGTWCLILDGCCHLFETEAKARRAYRMSLQDPAVR